MIEFILFFICWGALSILVFLVIYGIAGETPATTFLVLCPLSAFFFVGLIIIIFTPIPLWIKRKELKKENKYIEMSFKDFKSMYYLKNWEKDLDLDFDGFPRYKRTYIIFNSLIDNYKYQCWGILEDYKQKREKEKEQIKDNYNADLIKELKEVSSQKSKK